MLDFFKTMEDNLSTKDRSIRAAVGVVLCWASYYNILPTITYGIMAGALGLAVIGTSAFGKDPIYKLFKFSTKD